MSKKNHAAKQPQKSTAAAVETAPAPVVPETVTVNPVTQEKKVMTITLVRSQKPRKGSSHVFTSPDLKGTVKFPASVFITGQVPDSLVLEGTGFSGVTTPKSKMTKEERAAAKAAMTPEQKLAAQKDRLARLQAKIAKLEGATAI